eukprot:TRINITY_DN4086_c1_g1_i1.p1 TRINITY_DN4086_c1_g1~~TRINITY_DN4086_c1_g1_i1.p1  ORF type:complete len:496 (+),score=104.14 TRINITY_DN4086_c1_g1_i1:275-1762(+)
MQQQQQLNPEQLFLTTTARLDVVSQSFKFLDVYISKIEEMMAAREQLNQQLHSLYDPHSFGYFSKWIPEFLGMHDSGKSTINNTIRLAKHSSSYDRKYMENTVSALRAKIDKAEQLKVNATECTTKHNKHVQKYAEYSAKRAEKIHKLQELAELATNTATSARSSVICDLLAVQEQHLSFFNPSFRNLLKLTETIYCQSKQKQAIKILIDHLSHLDMNPIAPPSPPPLLDRSLSGGQLIPPQETQTSPKFTRQLTRKSFFNLKVSIGDKSHDDDKLKNLPKSPSPTAISLKDSTEKLQKLLELDVQQPTSSIITTRVSPRSRSNSMTTFSSLHSVLENPIALKHFHEFTKRKMCDEYVLFWMEVEDFRKFRFRERKDTKNRLIASSICENYLRDGGDHELNLDLRLRRSVFEQLACPERDMFSTVQAAVVRLMTGDIFLQFGTSPEYKKMISEMTKKDFSIIDCSIKLNAKKKSSGLLRSRELAEDKQMNDTSIL